MRAVNRAIPVVALSAVAAVGTAALATWKYRRGKDPLREELLGEFEPDRRFTVAADDGTPLAVSEIASQGDAMPSVTVVGVHGFALSQRSWHFQRRALEKLVDPTVRQVYYDHRAHGLSGSASVDVSTIEQLALDLDAVLRAAVPHGPIVLLGHSMGGMVIMELAAQKPELFGARIRGVAFIATAAGEIGRRGVPRGFLSKYNPVTRGVSGLAGWQPGLVEFARAASGQLTRQAIRHLAFGDRDVNAKLVDFMLDMVAVTPVRGLTNFVKTLGTHNRYAALAGLAHVPVLVIGADADRITPYAHTERIIEELPHANVAVAHGAGHMVLLEQPDLVNRNIVALIRASLKSCAAKDFSDTENRKDDEPGDE